MTTKNYIFVDVTEKKIVGDKVTSTRPGEVILREKIDMLFAKDGKAMSLAKQYRPDFVKSVRKGNQIIAVEA